MSSVALPSFALWDKMAQKKAIVSFDLELTARCNNDCRHCYINLPAADAQAKAQELSAAAIDALAGQAVEMGALWCLLTGGEPLLRDDFEDIYTRLKRRGLLISIFTNAIPVTASTIRLFTRYPPRDIEVTVYGATAATYERVTRRPGSYSAFRRGLDLLLESGIKVRLKAMALRSNAHEMAEIAGFCRARTKDFFRFDPLLHLRFDGNAQRNEEIRSERLSPQEIVAAEQGDAPRFEAMQNGCDKLILSRASDHVCNHLFHCGAGKGNFVVGYDGKLRLCSSLWHPDTVYDLRSSSLRDFWRRFVPIVLQRTSDNAEFLSTCRSCSFINLCLWCPAHAYLETGRMDQRVAAFCDVAHARAAAIGVSPQTGAV
jgi:radical SAM protein with 4Fe4S-binding SPASM domain